MEIFFFWRRHSVTTSHGVKRKNRYTYGARGSRLLVIVDFPFIFSSSAKPKGVQTEGKKGVFLFHTWGRVSLLPCLAHALTNGQHLVLAIRSPLSWEETGWPLTETFSIVPCCASSLRSTPLANLLMMAKKLWKISNFNSMRWREIVRTCICHRAKLAEFKFRWWRWWWSEHAKSRTQNNLSLVGSKSAGTVPRPDVDFRLFTSNRASNQGLRQMREWPMKRPFQPLLTAQFNHGLNVLKGPNWSSP